jgi:adenylate cyclase
MFRDLDIASSSVLDNVAPAYHRGMRSLTLAELAEEVGAPRALVERLVAIGQVRPLPDGRFDPRDEAIVATVRALLDAGIAEGDIDWLVREFGGGFEAVGRMFEAPGPRADGTYADLRAELGVLGDRLPAIFAAFGAPEPAPNHHLRLDEERVIRGFVEIWHIADPGGDADVRIARLAGETSRRLAEGWLDAWDATARPALASQGAPASSSQDDAFDPTDPSRNPAIRAAVVGRELVSWLHERHLEQTLNRRIIDAVENALVRAGRLQAHPASPPAIAFVDLSGFTTLTIERGDPAAAEVAGRLQTLADRAVRDADGRVVKLLGDGVLLRFGGAADAIRSVLRLVADVEAAGLPPAHAGIAAGFVVVRDGDVYGQTVNLAARIAGQAGPGQVVVEEGAVIALPAATATFEPLGRVTLKGIPDEVGLWLARPAVLDAP